MKKIRRDVPLKKWRRLLLRLLKETDYVSFLLSPMASLAVSTAA